jgi:hypothetical protein
MARDKKGDIGVARRGRNRAGKPREESPLEGREIDGVKSERRRHGAYSQMLRDRVGKRGGQRGKTQIERDGYGDRKEETEGR